MKHDTISIRPLEKKDIPYIVDYFLNADEQFLKGMGVNPSKLPSRMDWIKRLCQEMQAPLNTKKFYYVIWIYKNKPIGHSNLTNIVYPEEAFMHLHMWDSDLRKKGMGTEIMRITLTHYFKDLRIKQLYCEPNAINTAPNRVMEKSGFDFIKEHVTTPGWLCFEQPVKRWLLTAEKFRKLSMLQPELQNEKVRLTPLTNDYFEELYEIASDPLIWEQHPSKTRYQKTVFASYFKQALDSKSAFIIYDNDTGNIIGSTRFYDLNIQNNSLAIGYTFLSRPYWGGTYNKSVKSLMLHHAFSLVETVFFHIGENNIRSQKAIEKLGAVKTGIEERVSVDKERVTHLVYEIRKNRWMQQQETVK